MLLPYYIASLNIEHAYYERTHEYLPFEGICFADTLELADPLAHTGHTQQAMWMTERNTERVEREQDAKIMVVIGNPPYNMGQMNENDNNKNRKYEVIDKRINATYAKDSKATLNNKLYDAYVKFFRWATDRLGGRDGIVCMVTNNSFVDQIAFDGMRQHLLNDFTAIYHIDLHGDVRLNPKLSGTTHNVFGIQVGVGITVAIRSASSPVRGLHYYRVPEDWRKEEKLEHLKSLGSIADIEWQQLEPDERNTWLTEGLQPEFAGFLPTGTREAKSSVNQDTETIFGTYSLGVATNRDSHVYAFDKPSVEKQAEVFVEIYNQAVDVLTRRGSSVNLDSLIDTTDERIKWTRQVKASLALHRHSQFNASHIRRSLYRPFTHKFLYFDNFWNEEQYQQPVVFPTPITESENTAICLTAIGSEKPFMTLMSGSIADLHLVGAGAGTQCFPYYVYNEDGSGRRENITDWALARFQAAYGADVTKRDIFHYVYGALHHPLYCERYAANLKRELPRIPLVAGADAFREVARIGGELATLHLGYEQAREYPLAHKETPGEQIDWRVGEKRMRLSADKTTLEYNSWLTLEGIPPEVYRYRLGNRSALEWVIDQYHVSTDSRSGITSDPNRDDDPQYIVRLIGQVVTVSVETVRLVDTLAQVVLVDPLTLLPA